MLPDFPGVTPAPQYSPKLTTQESKVKPSKPGGGFQRSKKQTSTRISRHPKLASETQLFNFDGCSRVRQFLPDGIGFFFRNAFLDRFRGRLDEILGFLEPQCGYLAND